MSYAYIWEFHVAPGQHNEFERHYGPHGTWVQLFRKADGHVETLLLNDRTSPDRYVTVDRWCDEQAFDAFRAAFGEQYEKLDRECERLTVSERSLGVFSEGV
ncbi:antibiotic biosynthesis monooxygenase family protein [Lysobacter sp. HA18]